MNGICREGERLSEFPKSFLTELIHFLRPISFLGRWRGWSEQGGGVVSEKKVTEVENDFISEKIPPRFRLFPTSFLRIRL